MHCFKDVLLQRKFKFLPSRHFNDFQSSNLFLDRFLYNVKFKLLVKEIIQNYSKEEVNRNYKSVLIVGNFHRKSPI